MNHETFNAYRIMWLMVHYDLPTETTKNRKDANLFRKSLLGFGFSMFQFSMYIRHTPTRESCDMHAQRVRDIIPPEGKICIFRLTDKQFGEMEIYHGAKASEMPKGPQQLLLF